MKSVPPGGCPFEFDVLFETHNVAPERVGEIREVLGQFASEMGNQPVTEPAPGMYEIRAVADGGDRSDAHRVVSRTIDQYTARLVASALDDEEWGFDFA